jgi:hypothetical protein
MLILIDSNFSFIRCVLVMHNKMKIAEILTYAVYKSQMGTTLTALMAFKHHIPVSCTVLGVRTLKKGTG